MWMPQNGKTYFWPAQFAIINVVLMVFIVVQTVKIQKMRRRLSALHE